MFNTYHHHHHGPEEESKELLLRAVSLLTSIQEQNKKIMDFQTQALGIISLLVAVTDKQSLLLAQEGTNLNQIGTNLATLLGRIPSGAVQQSILDGLNAELAKMQPVSDAIQSHVDFSATLRTRSADGTPTVPTVPITSPVVAPIAGAPVAAPVVSSAIDPATKVDPGPLGSDGSLPGGARPVSEFV